MILAKNHFDKLVTMATKERPSLIYEIENFANTCFGKVTKFQGNGLLRFGVLSHLLGWRRKTPSVGAYRVNSGYLPIC